MAASNFAKEFGETELGEEYAQGAAQMRQAMDQFLFLKEENRFARMIHFTQDGSIEKDATIDASLSGTFAFGAYSANDPKVQSTMEQIYKKLWNPNAGGLSRYENDSYYRRSSSGPGNPWFVTTLWFAQYVIARAKNRENLEEALKLMEWVADHALPSGVLAEQVNPDTNEPISVSPLTWSHGAYIATVQLYLNKLLELETCAACGLPKYSKYRNLSS